MKFKAVVVKEIGLKSADGKPLALVATTKPKWRGLVEVPPGVALAPGTMINLRLEEGVWRIM